jgi:nicotinamidase-related amidase
MVAMSPLDSASTALLVIDVQKAFDEIEAAGRRRNNPDAVPRIATLLRYFRTNRLAIFHVRHASLDESSRFRIQLPGFQARDEARELPDEPVIVKTVNSAFIGTDLDHRLRHCGITSVVIVGATTNHCVETTARMAGNLGYDTKLVRDATWTFAQAGLDGETYSAEQVHRMSLANLAGEFAEIVSAAEVVRRLTSDAR